MKELSKVLVTGASGFIGKAVVKELKSKGHVVTAMVRKTSQIDFLKSNNIPIVYGDLNDLDGLKSAFHGQQAIVHVAGYVSDWGKKEDFFKGIYLGTKNVVEACSYNQIRRLLYFSSASVFGGLKNRMVNEKAPLKPVEGWYAKCKVMVEKMLQDHIRKNEMNITIVYPTWVYGEGDLHFVPVIIDNIKRGQMGFFGHNGSNVIEINYVQNLAAAVSLIIDNPATFGEGYILTDDPKISFKEFVNAFAKLMGHKEIKLSMPYPLAYAMASLMEITYRILNFKGRPYITRMLVHLFGNSNPFDNSKLKALGFRQQHTFEQVMQSDCYKLKSNMAWNN